MGPETTSCMQEATPETSSLDLHSDLHIKTREFDLRHGRETYLGGACNQPRASTSTKLPNRTIIKKVKERTKALRVVC